MESNVRRSHSASRNFDLDEKQFKPALKPVSPSCSGDSYSHTSDESITKTQRHVFLTKTADMSFGFNIIGGTMGEGIYISFILAGGLADQSKKLFKGDQILKINSQELMHLNHCDVVQLLKESTNNVNLLVIHKPEEFRNCENHLQEFEDVMQSSDFVNLSTANFMGSLRTTSKKTLYVRTLFNYEVSKDCGLPNKGLSFKFGDILHVTNASDPEWWQARKVNLGTGEDDTNLGIIPSKTRVERKNKTKLKKVRICVNEMESVNIEKDETTANNTLSIGDIQSTTNSLPRHHNGKVSDNQKLTNGGLFSLFKGKSKNKNQTNLNSELDNEPVLSKDQSDSTHFYQPVFQEENSLVRPVVILGVAKEEINKSLIKDFNNEFGVCIPHTTRPMGVNDLDGKEFYFISLNEMHSLMSSYQFIETGKSGNYLYGTSVQSVIDVAEAGKHCILDISCMAVKRLYMRRLWPITILIQVQSPEEYRTVVEKSVSDEHCLKLMSKISRLKQEFLPYITGNDYYEAYCTGIISGSNFDSIFQQVIRTISIHNGRRIWLPSKVSL